MLIFRDDYTACIGPSGWRTLRHSSSDGHFMEKKWTMDHGHGTHGGCTNEAVLLLVHPPPPVCCAGHVSFAFFIISADFSRRFQNKWKRKRKEYGKWETHTRLPPYLRGAVASCRVTRQKRRQRTHVVALQCRDDAEDRVSARSHHDRDAADNWKLRPSCARNAPERTTAKSLNRRHPWASGQSDRLLRRCSLYTAGGMHIHQL